MIPYKGAVVSDISLQELEEIYEIRVVLERLATRLALNNIETLDIKAIRRLAGQVEESFHREDFQDMMVTNTNFHDYIFGLSLNATLQKMINELKARCHIVRHSAWSSPEFISRSLKEHQLYITAFERKDLAMLEELAEKHITHAKMYYVTELSGESV